MSFGHSFWLESPIDLRPTRLNYILQDLFRDTPLDHIWRAQLMHQKMDMWHIWQIWHIWVLNNIQYSCLLQWWFYFDICMKSINEFISSFEVHHVKTPPHAKRDLDWIFSCMHTIFQASILVTIVMVYLVCHRYQLWSSLFVSNILICVIWTWNLLWSSLSYIQKVQAQVYIWASLVS